jgi:hypothetical protein
MHLFEELPVEETEVAILLAVVVEVVVPLFEELLVVCVTVERLKLPLLLGITLFVFVTIAIGLGFRDVGVVTVFV